MEPRRWQPRRQGGSPERQRSVLDGSLPPEGPEEMKVQHWFTKARKSHLVRVYALCYICVVCCLDRRISPTWEQLKRKVQPL